MILEEEAPLKLEINDFMLKDSELKTLNFNIKSNNYLVRSYIATESKA